MYYFVDLLKCFAVFFITNSHLAGVFPTDIFSNGGMLGNVIFFFTSGFCLTKINMSFPKWYIKRLYRVYPAVWIISVIYMVFGFFSLDNHNVFYYLIYPLNNTYHFVKSILVLYIPFYAVDFLVKRTRITVNMVLGIICVVHVIVYFVFYDYSYYHIDDVLEPMIRFLFFESMLLGRCVNIKKHYSRRRYLSNGCLKFF